MGLPLDLEVLLKIFDEPEKTYNGQTLQLILSHIQRRRGKVKVIFFLNLKHSSLFCYGKFLADLITLS